MKEFPEVCVQLTIGVVYMYVGYKQASSTSILFMTYSADVSKVTIYGKLREGWEYQQEQQYLSDQGLHDDMHDDDAMTSYSKLEQITSVSKLNVIPNAGMKRLWVEGNRIKVGEHSDTHIIVLVS